MPAIKILIADNHPVFRRGLVSILKDEFIITGEANNGNEVLELISKNCPDVILLDLRMPVLDGYGVLKKLKADKSAVKCIVLTMYDESVINGISEHGAYGYLSKNAEPEEITAAIKNVAANGYHFKMSTSFSTNGGGVQVSNTGFSEKEKEILQLIYEGHSSEQIGRKLNMSRRTVEDYRQKMMDRTGIHNINGLIGFAARSGTIC